MAARRTRHQGTMGRAFTHKEARLGRLRGTGRWPLAWCIGRPEETKTHMRHRSGHACPEVCPPPSCHLSCGSSWPGRLPLQGRPDRLCDVASGDLSGGKASPPCPQPPWACRSSCPCNKACSSSVSTGWQGQLAVPPLPAGRRPRWDLRTERGATPHLLPGAQDPSLRVTALFDVLPGPSTLERPGLGLQCPQRGGPGTLRVSTGQGLAGALASQGDPQQVAALAQRLPADQDATDTLLHPHRPPPLSTTHPSTVHCPLSTCPPSSPAPSPLTGNKPGAGERGRSWRPSACWVGTGRPVSLRR